MSSSPGLSATEKGSHEDCEEDTDICASFHIVAQTNTILFSLPGHTIAYGVMRSSGMNGESLLRDMFNKTSLKRMKLAAEQLNPRNIEELKKKLRSGDLSWSTTVLDPEERFDGFKGIPTMLGLDIGRELTITGDIKDYLTQAWGLPSDEWPEMKDDIDEATKMVAQYVMQGGECPLLWRRLLQATDKS